MKDAALLEAQARWLTFLGELWLAPPTERQREGAVALAAIFPEEEGLVIPNDLQAWTSSWYLHLRVPGEQALLPYECHHLPPEAQPKGPERIAQVAGMYSAAGFEVDPFSHEPPDHIGHELRFLGALTARLATLCEQQKEPQAERVLSWIHGFALDHGRSWLPRFVEHCKKVALDPYFVALAKVSEALVEDLV